MAMALSNTAFNPLAPQSCWAQAETSYDSHCTLRAQVVSRDHPKWLAVIVQRLDEMGRLSSGWAGPGTVPPLFDVVLECLKKMQVFMPFEAVPPAILPTPQGGIQLEWHCAHWDLEVEFGPDGSGDFWGEDQLEGQEISGCVDAYEKLTLAIQSLSDRVGG